MIWTTSYWARSMLRHHRRAAVTLALLTLVAVVVPLVAASGARRTASSIDRMRSELRPYHLDVQFEEEDAPSDAIERLEAIPGVELAAEGASILARPAGSGLDFFESFGQGGLDDRVGRDFERPRLDSGRRPSAADEVLLSRSQSDALDLGVGDTLVLDTFSPAGIEAVFAGGTVQFDGPQLSLKIVGVGRQPEELTAGAGSPAPLFVVAPAFFDEWAGRVHWFDGIYLVRLDRGADGVAAFTSDARVAFDERADLAIHASEEGPRIEDAVRAQEVALALLAAVAALTGLVAIVQAAIRMARAAEGGGQVLRALGLQRRHRAAAPVLVVAVPVAIGAVAAAIVAGLLSGVFPTGPAGRVEPDPGLLPDFAVLGAGIAIVVLSVLAIVAPAASWDRVTARAPSGSGLGGLLSRRFSGVALAVGVHAAVGRATPSGASARRSALVAVALGVAGLVGSLVFAASLTRLVEQPARFGWTFDYEVGLGDDLEDEEALALAEEVAKDPDVSGSLYARIGTKRVNGGSIPFWGVMPISGDLQMGLVSGRTVRSDDEIVLGGSMLDSLSASVGDTIEVASDDGPIALRIVGQGLAPTSEVDDPAGAGLVTLRTFHNLPGSGGYPNAYVSAGDGADRAALRERLNSEVGFATDVVPPPVVTNLDRVQQSPYLLAGYLGLLGAAASAHAMITTVRQRRQELAALRTLGFDRRQLVVSVLAQSATITAIGVLVGLPFGVAAGRVSWTVVATGLGFAGDPRTPLAALLTVGPTAMVVAVLVALGPALWVARQRPAAILRVE